MTITLPDDSRVWTLTPQQLTHGSKPDFVLRSSTRPSEPVAIFTDGGPTTPSPQHNRIADDAAKRNTLRTTTTSCWRSPMPISTDGSAKSPDYDWVNPR